MKLIDYMKLHGKTDQDIAAAVGKTPSGVRKWMYGERIPRPDQMRKITEITGGEVTANDFFDEPQKAAS